MDEISQRNGLTNEEAQAFIGPNAEVYMEKWQAHSTSAYKGWNFPAMFFSLEWMIYRKLYGEATIFFFLQFFLSSGFILAFGIGGKLIADVFRIVMGALGNVLYRKKAIRTVDLTSEMTQEKRLAFLAQNGGVSVSAVVICICAEVLLGTLMAVH